MDRAPFRPHLFCHVVVVGLHAADFGAEGWEYCGCLYVCSSSFYGNRSHIYILLPSLKTTSL